MLYTMVILGYAAANLIIALFVLAKSRHNILSQFYFFCVSCLLFLGTAAYFLSYQISPLLWSMLYHIAIFVYALLPFFFLHFIVIFVRRYEILKSKSVIGAIYSVGLLSYAIVLLHFIATPLSDTGHVTESGYIFYLTWMTIFFAIGIAMLYESARGFYEKAGKANILFVCFVLLLLVLPGPFTDSVFFNILHLGWQWYYFSCTLAIVIAVYFIFRHKIVVSTLYDALRSSLAVVNDILLTTNDQFQIETIQGAVTPLLGYKAQELIGKKLGDLLEQKEYLSQYRELVIHQKMKQSYFDSEMITKSGQRIPLNFSFAPMMFGKEISGFAGIARDMTEHRKLEDQLRQAQKMESLGTLAGGIAHDFNNILQILLVNTTSLLKNIGDRQRVEQILDINKQAIDRGTGLVQQILTFARKTEVQFKPVDVNALINEVVKMLSLTFPKTVVFNVVTDSNLPRISADRNQLHQVLLNLCVNARDVLPNGGQITIRSSVVTGAEVQKTIAEVVEGSYVSISVTDTGMGMAEHIRSRVFEPFFTTKEKGKGTGLGLAVVYGIVKAHRGFIDVESAIGIGTTFRIFLPNLLHEAASTRPLKDTSQVRQDGHELILVVEDEQVLLDHLKSLLEEKGYHVLTAKDGLEAYETYRQNANQIALVVSDTGLPVLDGWNSISKMKEINPSLKAIVASGYFDPLVKEREARNGISEFVLKPYNPQDLLNSVRKVLMQRGAGK
ncbi:MAG TPA: ATP-binding protein [Bacteroidota bacterium]|nr:ATP-binding protein [Bacteroidota bacterium]